MSLCFEKRHLQFALSDWKPSNFSFEDHTWFVPKPGEDNKSYRVDAKHARLFPSLSWEPTGSPCYEKKKET